MKYKVLKGTELFKKLVSIRNKCIKASKEADKLAIELGGKGAATTGWHKAGGINAIDFGYSNTPDKEFWMQPDRHNNKTLFYPRNNKKANLKNQVIHDKIKNLPIVTYSEFNGIIGFKNQWLGFTNYKSYGLQIFREYALIEIGAECNYKPMPDMIEILESEYNKLKSEKPE